MADLRFGTSAFTAAGWPGTFYPEGLPEREYLSYYARHGPGTIEQFRELWRKQVATETRNRNPAEEQGQLFK